MSQPTTDSFDEGNSLAVWLTECMERLRHHRTSILAGLAAAGIALVAWALVSSQSAAIRAESWDAYLAGVATGNPAAIQDVISRYPDSVAADWSRLVLAEMALREGADLAFSDTRRSKGRLGSAVQLYEQVLVVKPQGLLAERATFGLAKAREALGNLEDAKKGYQTIAGEHPSSGLSSLASEHAKSLDQKATREWYEWFESQDVAVKKEPAGQPATEGGSPQP